MSRRQALPLWQRPPPEHRTRGACCGATRGLEWGERGGRRVLRRDGVDYRTFAIAGLEDVPTYGVDGPPALGVILACVGGFGPRPDIVLSGINHGVNVGRSALHSGTIGAALTAAQFGIRGLATSIRYGPDPVPWQTAADLAQALITLLETAPTGHGSQLECSRRGS